jgi:hypothetical protein
MVTSSYQQKRINEICWFCHSIVTIIYILYSTVFSRRAHIISIACCSNYITTNIFFIPPLIAYACCESLQLYRHLYSIHISLFLDYASYEFLEFYHHI